jgi:iron complex outermembrane receptor protein
MAFALAWWLAAPARAEELEARPPAAQPAPAEPPPDESPAEAGDDAALDVELELSGPSRATKPDAIDEVVVTAQKREQAVQDVPISITALTGNFLKETGTNSLLDIQRFTPNVSLNQVTDSRSTAIRIRGIGNDGTNAGIDPAVGVFIDGVYQGRTGLAAGTDLADVDRIEVLRGPQGTLFGKNTAAGAIAIVTKLPQLDEWDAFIENNFGNYNDYQLRGTVNVPVLEDRIAMRLTGYFVQHDPYDENLFDGSGRNDGDRNGARLRTLFRLTDDLELVVWADYATEQTTCCVPDISSYTGPPSLDVRFPDLAGQTGRPLPPLDPFDRVVDANEETTNSTQTIGTAAELNWTVRDHVLTWLSAYRQFDSSSLLDGDFSGYDAVIQKTEEQFHQWSSELRLASPSGERLEWVSGLFFYYQQDDTQGQTGIGPEWLETSSLGPIIDSEGGADENGDVSNFDTNTHQTWSYAAFGQGTYALLDQLSLTVGLRGTYEQKARVGSQIAGFTGVDAGPFGPDRYADEDFSVFDLSPMASLQWFPTLDSMAFVRFARGFKSGGFNQLRTAGGVNTQFDDEVATDVEIGFRSTWLEGMVTLNATAFHTWYDEFQAQAFDGSAFSVTNAGSLRSYGFETDGLLVPHPSLQLGFGTGFNPTKYESFANSPCTAQQNWAINSDTPLARKACTQNLSGRPLDNAPEWSVTLFGNYERELGTLPRFDVPLLGFLTVNWSFRSAVFLQQDLDPHLRQPGYGLLNLRTGVRTDDGHWEFAFGVQNVTNQSYGVAGFDVPIVNGFAIINGPPRTFLGTIRYRF